MSNLRRYWSLGPFLTVVADGDSVQVEIRSKLDIKRNVMAADVSDTTEMSQALASARRYNEVVYDSSWRNQERYDERSRFDAYNALMVSCEPFVVLDSKRAREEIRDFLDCWESYGGLNSLDEYAAEWRVMRWGEQRVHVTRPKKTTL